MNPLWIWTAARVLALLASLTQLVLRRGAG